MSRRRRAEKREVLPDARFGCAVIGKLVTVMMYDGNKERAQKIVYGALDRVASKSGDDPVPVLSGAVDNVKPSVEVRSRRVGGATYQVPVEVRPDRRLALSLRWILQAARARSERTMQDRLCGEILDAVNNRGGAVKKREDTHRMAESNKVFSHYRW